MTPFRSLPCLHLLLRARGVVVLGVCWFALGLPARSANVLTNVYTKRILVANRPGFEAGALIDEHLVNPWGIALRPPGAGGHIWISNAGNLSTSLYIGDVHGVPLHQDGLKLVYLNGPLISFEDGLANVTGQVYNAASDFPGQPVEFPVTGPGSDLSSGSPVPIGTISGSAKFVFVTTEGTINAWRSNTAASMNTAILVKDYSEHGADRNSPASRTGPRSPEWPCQARRGSGTGCTLADFQNSMIRVLNHEWVDITTSVPFARPEGLPPGFSPYNIQLLGGRLYVTFAALNIDADEAAASTPGPGTGHVAAYDLDGRILQEFADAGRLNAPWGLAIAPPAFGAFGGALLVGNFGDGDEGGTIAAFELSTGAFLDYLRDDSGKPISIDGLWGLAFGNGVSLGDADSLYFTAGPNKEADGIFGRLRYSGPGAE